MPPLSVLGFRIASFHAQEDRKNREMLANHRQKMMSDRIKLENALYREIENANGSVESSRDFGRESMHESQEDEVLGMMVVAIGIIMAVIVSQQLTILHHH